MSIKLPPPRPQRTDFPPPPLRDLDAPRKKPKKDKLHIRIHKRYKQNPAGFIANAVFIALLWAFILYETAYLYKPALGRGEHRLFFALQAPFLFRYDLHLPQAPEPGTKYPLIVIMRDMNDPPYAAQKLVQESPLFYPAFVMIPRIPHHTAWATPDDPRFAAAAGIFPDALPVITTMIGMVTASYPIDPDRIYLVGDKDGARGVYALASAAPTLFAAALTTAGSWPPENITIGATKLRVYNGTADTIAPPGLAAALTRSARLQGSNATFHPVETYGHNIASVIYRDDNIWNWLFAQTRAPTP